MRDEFPDGVHEVWRYGKCYPMAMALSDLLGWPVVAITVDLTPGHRRHPGCDRHVVHAWVRAPDGRGFDAGGFFEDAEAEASFLDRHRGRRFTESRTEEFPDGAAFAAHMDAVSGPMPDWAEIRAWFMASIPDAAAIARDRIVPVALEATAAVPAMR